MTIQHPSDFETGLEDFDMEDAVVPRLTIAHKDFQFKDSLSNEQFDTVKVIILGLVKQRVLWHPTVDDGDWPMCRSANHELGFPNVSDDQPKEKRFPWATSGFDPKDFPADSEGLIRLPCDGCALKEWGSHPDGKKPYCAEQFTLPVLYDPREDDNWVPAIMTFQKTGLKPLKSYLTSFARSRNAAFQAITEIGLTPTKRGTTDYSVPWFKRVGDTDEENWREFSTNYRTMKDFLEADPGSREETESTSPSPSSNVAKPPAAKKPEAEEPKDVVDAVVVEETPAAQPEAAAPEGDDDLPF